MQERAAGGGSHVALTGKLCQETRGDFLELVYGENANSTICQKGSWEILTFAKGFVCAHKTGIVEEG